MPMTVVEKILARASGLPSVKVGDVVEPRVDLAMSHENAALVANQFKEVFEGTGLPATVWDPAKIAIVLDHRVPAESSKTATNQKKIRELVAKQGITKFHDVRGDVGARAGWRCLQARHLPRRRREVSTLPSRSQRLSVRDGIPRHAGLFHSGA